MGSDSRNDGTECVENALSTDGLGLWVLGLELVSIGCRQRSTDNATACSNTLPGMACANAENKRRMFASVRGKGVRVSWLVLVEKLVQCLCGERDPIIL